MNSSKKIYLRIKIFLIYFNIIIIFLCLGFCIHESTIIITIPLGIIVSNKITKKDKFKLRKNDSGTNASSHLKQPIMTNPCSSNYNNSTDYNNCSNSNSTSYNIETNSKINYCQYYRPKRYITTLNELHFYEVLIEIAKELDLALFCQVSLYSIIEPRKNLDYSTRTKFLNKINRKSIDFVLADKSNCRIKLCIELDDSTHYRKKRIERDEFLDELFEQLGINLLRYPVYTVYYKDTLKKKILENMKEHCYID